MNYYDREYIEKGKGTIDYFKDIKSEVGAIKKIEIHQYSENFIFSDYLVDLPSNRIHMVMESENGDKIFMSNANCGYNGSGPRGSLKIIREAFTNIDEKEMAIIENEVFNNNGLILEFDCAQVNIKYPKIIFNHIHTSFDTSYMNINQENFSVDLVNQVVRIYNPQKANFLGMLNLINATDIKKMSYYIGKHSPLDFKYRFRKEVDLVVDPFRDLRDDFYSDLSGANIEIEGKKFRIVCFIEPNSTFSVIDSIYLEIFKSSLVSYDFFGKPVIKHQNKVTMLKRMINFIKNKPIGLFGEVEYNKKAIYGHRVKSLDEEKKLNEY
ncbi:hypothetical protein [Carnobacterium maltaromaticum]|uniref:hypothetical protein n=1 Tax=Carnobacterium maltaromaticum TaxID=2751 RepID=UPI0012F78EE8|nr:hypothetical protein [Carnobacterium maltaromaticum]